MILRHHVSLFCFLICQTIIVVACQPSWGQTATETDLYVSAMKEYESKNYDTAAKMWDGYWTANQPEVAEHRQYNGACILALAGRKADSLQMLHLLADKHFYSDAQHLSTDPDLDSLRGDPRWASLIDQVKANKKSLPRRTREKVKTELLKAKSLLEKDNGQLWGHSFWNNEILVLDYDNTIYSLSKLPNSKTDDGILFYKRIPANTLGFSNSAQQYEGKRRAVVLVNYLDDDSATIIHELFHVLQLGTREFRSDPVNYLDNHDARIWLRLEFQALRNALRCADDNDRDQVIRFLVDAASFRKIRQSKYESSVRDELEIETLEGMANYTGLKLSTSKNKFLTAISEIDGRESASTFTRPFPYATGPAYGLLFDFLGIEWRSDMDTIYNFRKMVEAFRGGPLATDEATMQIAKSRNNYETIFHEETKRKQRHDQNIAFYSRLLLNQPTLRASVTDGTGSYSMSFDMNGTLVLGDHEIVYSQIKGVDVTGKNFGNFQSIPGKDRLGVAGILRRKDGELVFPFPLKIDGQKIMGDSYEIELNEQWEVKKDEEGNLNVVPRN